MAILSIMYEHPLTTIVLFMVIFSGTASIIKACKRRKIK